MKRVGVIYARSLVRISRLLLELKESLLSLNNITSIQNKLVDCLILTKQQLVSAARTVLCCGFSKS